MARAGVLLLYDLVLVSLAIEDFRKRKISNCYVMKILFLSVIAVVVIPEVTVISRGMGMLIVSVPMTLLALMVPGSFGGGDAKLVLACGAFLGLELIVRGTIIALFFAGIYSVCLICIKKGKRNVQFALGPFLSVGYILSSLCLFE